MTSGHAPVKFKSRVEVSKCFSTAHTGLSPIFGRGIIETVVSSCCLRANPNIVNRDF
jgi:hypothetical protein